MRSIARHTKVFGRAFTIVFLLACSGFATILHICAGEISQHYDTSSTSDQAACPNRQLPLPVARMFVHNVGDCQKKTIVLGIAVYQALEEKDSKAKNAKALSLLSFTSILPPPCNILYCSSCYCTKSISPSSVEKFILNATLLI
jgi:hypothetical protein